MLLMNGMMECMLPVKLRGAGATGNVRTCWTRNHDVIGPHHFTKSWLEQIPNRSGQPYVMRFPKTVSTTTQSLMSVVGFDLISLRTLPPVDGTIGQADRQQVTWKYSGILAGPPPSGATAVLLNQMGRGLGWGLGSGMG